jgi:hypothetical protein
MEAKFRLKPQNERVFFVYGRSPQTKNTTLTAALAAKSHA